MEGMLRIEGDTVTSGKSMLVVLCLAAGTVIGELIGIEKGFERFGEWLKHKTGNSGDSGFVNAFVTSSLTVCIGAMAIVGAIQDGMLNDYSTLMVKSVLDLIIIAVMTSSMGKGCVFSAIRLYFRGSGHRTCTIAGAGYDRDGGFLPVPDRLSPDFLRGRESGLG